MFRKITNAAASHLARSLACAGDSLHFFIRRTWNTIRSRALAPRGSSRPHTFTRRRAWRLLWRTVLLTALGGLILFGLPYWIAESYARPRSFTPQDAPNTRVAIVFGAGLTRNGTPSAVLSDRVETAAKLYFEGKVEKLLMSGDNRFVDYNEPGSMRDYAIRLGVPADAIVLDYAGRRTYDTCYRARHIFNVDQAILVTQGFHLPRALITCNNLGVQSSGVPAEVRQYRIRSYAYWTIREIPATTIALWEVWVSRPLPVLGKPEPIFSQNDIQSPISFTRP